VPGMSQAHLFYEGALILPRVYLVVRDSVD
jgi:hypothetical protein